MAVGFSVVDVGPDPDRGFMLWGRGMGEDDFYRGVRVFVGDDDFRANSGSEALLPFNTERRPEGGEAPGFESDGFDGEIADFAGGGFAFKFGQFLDELAKAILQRSVQFLELLHADSVGHVEIVELSHFRSDGFALRFHGGRLLLALGDLGF